MRSYYERAPVKTAKELLDEFGEGLIGRRVRTLPLGAWPGGSARIVKVRPDPEAPEIVFEVRGTGQKVQNAIAAGDLEDEVMGVFDYEEVELLA